jgi:hypothetical protein
MAMIEAIREAKRAQPFRPFSLHMVDGTDYVVEHPDFIVIPPTKHPREVIFYTVEKGNRSGDEDDTTHWINLGLVRNVIVPGSEEEEQFHGDT